MTVTAKAIADEVSEQMRRNGLDVLTMRWPAFYELCERERLKAGFIDSLAAHLTTQSIMLAKGHSVVAFVKDFDFSPFRNKA